jgi:hypothetical protein
MTDSLTTLARPADRALHVTVAESAHRIGKNLLWAPRGSTDGVWRDDDAPGEWRKPSEFKGAGPDVEVVKQYSFHQLQGEPTASFRADLRRELISHPELALMLGVVSDDHKELLDGEGKHLKVRAGKLPRKIGAFVDAPRAWLTLDCDGLDLRKIDPDIDVIERDSELPDILADVLDRLGLDWLIADFTMQLSSSHGLADKHTLRAHIDWCLKEPLTLLQQKRIAEHVNVLAEEHGFGRIVDTSIYEPSRLIFTAPARLFKRTWVQGKGIVNSDVNPLRVQRVRYVHRGDPVIEPQGELRKVIETDGKIAKIKSLSLKMPEKKPASTATALVPGNVYQAIRARVYAAAIKTPEHRTAAVIEKLRAKLATDIEALPDSDGENLARRLRHIAPAEIRRSWDAALAKRRPWHEAEARPMKARHAPDAARMVLQRMVLEDFEHAIEAHKGATETDETLLATLPPVIHTLYRVPPGVGKTHAALAAVRHQHITTGRVSYLAPTNALSQEAAARRRLSLPADDYSQTLVRHHQGRRAEGMCIDAHHDALAKTFEDAGRSPVKAVCGVCPKRDACRWYAQHQDKGAGLVFGQHAHATTSLAKLRSDTEGAPTFGVIDESMIGTLLQEQQLARKLSSLRAATSRGAIRNRAGDLIRGATTDLIASRTALLDALASCTGKRVPPSAVTYLNGIVRITTKDGGTLLRSRLEDALLMEREASRAADVDMQQSVTAHKAALAAGRKGAHQITLLRRASNAIKVSRWFTDAYRAVAASLSIPDRPHIFGLALRGRGASRKIALHLRADLPVIFGARHFVWLDGTANPDIWRACFGRLPVEARVVDIPVQPGAYRLTQYPDRAYSKSMFLNPSKPEDARSNLSRLRRFITAKALEHRASTHDCTVNSQKIDVLVVTALPVERALRSLSLPANVAITHYNALRGLDAYKHVPCAIIVGRSLPQPDQLEAMTEALHYDDPGVPTIATSHGRPTHGRRTITLANSTSVSIPAEMHPDARVESLRQQLVDAEVQQALMRLRLFDRNPTNEADIHVFGQADLGLPVHALADWADAERSDMELVLSSGVFTRSPDLICRLAYRTLEGLSERHLERLIKDTETPPGWIELSVKVASAAYSRKVWVAPYILRANSLAIHGFLEDEFGLSLARVALAI